MSKSYRRLLKLFYTIAISCKTELSTLFVAVQLKSTAFIY